MEAQKIKIELDLAPEIALYLSLYLISTAKDDLTLQQSITKAGFKHIFEISQNIMDQISSKTDFDNLKLRSILSSLKNLDNIDDFQSELGDLLN